MKVSNTSRLKIGKPVRENRSLKKKIKQLISSTDIVRAFKKSFTKPFVLTRHQELRKWK